MFQQILVPLDGSARAEQVLPAAARLARASRGSITLLTVVSMAPEAASYHMEGPFLPQNIFRQDLTEARSYLDQVSKRSDLAGIALEKQVELGDPAVMILSCAEEQQIDLVVMSSHGSTSVTRWILGSVAEKVARHAPVPVLMLREGGPLRTHIRFDGTRSVRALVPLDISTRALDAIPPAAALVAALSSPGYGQLHLTHLIVMPEDTPETMKGVVLQDAKEQLAAMSQSIRDGLMVKGGPDLAVMVSWAASLESDIAEGILRIAEHGEPHANVGRVEQCDLIAMTTHGFAGSRRWAMGSITERVLRATSLPLLIVRPGDMIEKECQKRMHRVETAT